jgi:5-dehydro-2-deoxygluconokinase
MAISASDFDENFIAQSKALLITGTHFSTEHIHRISNLALDYARRSNVRTVLDIDYRPVLWGLTGKADGEQRFIASETVTAHLQGILPKFDLVVGTEEEIRIAGGAQDLIASLKAGRKVSAATLEETRGPLGCAVIDGAIPATLDAAYNSRGLQIDVLNVLGAGEAFMSGFLKGWLNAVDYENCCRYANACGALVVSRHACSPSMPTPVELDYFLANAERLQRPDQDVTLARLHRVTVPRPQWSEVFVFAFDHRTQFEQMVRDIGVSEARLPALKRLLVEAVRQTEAELGLNGRVGILADDRYGQDALNEATGRGWWIGRPVELPGSNPLEFDQGLSIASYLASWPQEQIVKCLVQLHPDDAVDNRLQQENQIQLLYQAVQSSGHELLLEIIPPKHLPQAADTVYRALKRLYNLGIYPEWWKLESMEKPQWQAIDALIKERDPYCRGVVVLGLDASIAALSESFAQARSSSSCRGFAVGRTIFSEPARQWLAGNSDDATLIKGVRANFEALIRAWQQAANQSLSSTQDVA